MFSRRGLLKEERGQALVELALLLPVLLLLLLGIMEFGRVFNAYLTVTSASREGARTAAVRATDEKIREAVQGAAGTLPGPLEIIIDPSPRERGRPVKVTVGYDVAIVFPVIQGIVPNPFRVKGATVMRVE